LCPKYIFSLIINTSKMKKFLFGMCMLAVVGTCATSCGKGEKADADNDTLVAKATSDSISQYYGMMAGGFIGSELAYYAQESGEKYDREEFLKGLQAVVGSEKEDAYVAGMNTGFRVLQDIKEMQKQGVQVDRDVILKEMRRMVLNDSVKKEQAQEYAKVYQDLMQGVQAQNQAREEAKKANSPEAKANVKAGEEFMAKVHNIKKTQSGLGYVIENPGEGTAIKDGDRVTVDYVGKHIDGSEFDKGTDAVMQPGQNLIPGFTEALKLLKAGGKATFYIPGHLAYGSNGVPQAKIGPNELLVFDITVKSVEAPVEQAPSKEIE
jgi:FKBP-type peptidyl-prolyl cis-trans isomerase FkpA/FKBP-type peptidyl-prolyl cis-trans isomerase FklB